MSAIPFKCSGSNNNQENDDKKNLSHGRGFQWMAETLDAHPI